MQRSIKSSQSDSSVARLNVRWRCSASFFGLELMNGRLISVSTTALVSGANVTQNRSFNYDRRGFLQSESHPEKGAAGNGSVSYFGYDSRGHATRKIDGPNDLTFTFDSAERLFDSQDG